VRTESGWSVRPAWRGNEAGGELDRRMFRDGASCERGDELVDIFERRIASDGWAVKRGVRIDLKPKNICRVRKSEKQQPGGEDERRVTY